LVEIVENSFDNDLVEDNFVVDPFVVVAVVADLDQLRLVAVDIRTHSSVARNFLYSYF